jgi:predicted PurR-regulated permease PerM
MAEQTLDISWEAIVRFFIIGFLVYVIFLVRDIVIWFFFALIISLLVEPVINFLRRLRAPKVISVILVYVGILGILGLVIYLTAPMFLFELNQFSQNLPDYFVKINPILKDLGIKASQNFDDFTLFLTSGLQQSSSGILRAIATFFGGVYSTLFIFTLAFFISLEDKGPERLLAFLSPRKYEAYVVYLFERAQSKVARWFGARILSCVFVGIASFIAFYVLGVKYAFILALISGVLNFVPYVGPTITLVLSVVFVGVSNSWLVAGYILIILLVIQEVENKALTPLLLKKFMDLPPVLVLLSLLVGGALFGFLGTIFAVPVFGIIYEFTKEFLEQKRAHEE